VTAFIFSESGVRMVNRWYAAAKAFRVKKTRQTKK
jgi:hypothetical protein